MIRRELIGRNSVFNPEPVLSDAEAFAVAESSGDEDPDMLARLGSSIYYGRGTEENKARGKELVEKAASSDSKWAQKLLSSL